jgi:hypothetical protein
LERTCPFSETTFHTPSLYMSEKNSTVDSDGSDGFAWNYEEIRM